MQNVSTKERIIDSALTLFSENGIESTSVEQIASSVGVKAPALYKHFKSKQEIVDSIFLMIFERYNAKIETEQREIESCLSSFDSYADKAEKAAELVGNALKSVFAASIQDDFLNRASRLSQIERFHFVKHIFSREFVLKRAAKQDDNTLSFLLLFFSIFSLYCISPRGRKEFLNELLRI